MTAADRRFFQCVSLAVLACWLFPLIGSAAAQLSGAWPRYDRELIPKLYRGDFAHISDDNLGRMDLEAMFMSFRSDEQARVKCSLLANEHDSSILLAYIHYLNSDSETGTFPSAEFTQLGVVSGFFGAPGAWVLDPNMIAMATEIPRQAEAIRPPPARTAPAWAYCSGTGGSSAIHAGTQLLVNTLEPIDLLSPDSSRIYRGELQRAAFNNGTVYLQQGTVVLMKAARLARQPASDSVVAVGVSVVAVIVDGRNIAVRFPSWCRSDARSRQSTRFPPAAVSVSVFRRTDPTRRTAPGHTALDWLRVLCCYRRRYR